MQRAPVQYSPNWSRNRWEIRELPIIWKRPRSPAMAWAEFVSLANVVQCWLCSMMCRPTLSEEVLNYRGYRTEGKRARPQLPGKREEKLWKGKDRCRMAVMTEWWSACSTDVLTTSSCFRDNSMRERLEVTLSGMPTYHTCFCSMFLGFERPWAWLSCWQQDEQSRCEFTGRHFVVGRVEAWCTCKISSLAGNCIDSFKGNKAQQNTDLNWLRKWWEVKKRKVKYWVVLASLKYW